MVNARNKNFILDSSQ